MKTIGASHQHFSSQRRKIIELRSQKFYDRLQRRSLLGGFCRDLNRREVGGEKAMKSQRKESDNHSGHDYLQQSEAKSALSGDGVLHRRSVIGYETLRYRP